MTITRKQAENIASVLSEGLPYIRKFIDKIIVVKYGGAAMSDTFLKESFCRDIALMGLVGMKPVIVHGGGPQIGKELEKAKIETKFENGLRITNKPTMNIVKKILYKQERDRCGTQKICIYLCMNIPIMHVCALFIQQYMYTCMYVCMSCM